MRRAWAAVSRLRRRSEEGRPLGPVGDEQVVQGVRCVCPDREIRLCHRQRQDRWSRSGDIAARVIGGAAHRAAFVLMVVMGRTVVMAALIMYGVRLRFAVAKQDRQGRRDALQRHHSERQQKYEFFEPSGHDGAGV